MEHYEKENSLASKQKEKKALENICNLWYGIPRETVNKMYDVMPSMMEAVPKAKGGSTMSELLKTMA